MTKSTPYDLLTDMLKEAGFTLPLRIRANRRAKNIILKIRDPHHLDVTYPFGIDIYSLAQAVLRKRPWIEETLAGLTACSSEIGLPERICCPGVDIELRTHYLNAPSAPAGRYRFLDKGPSEVCIKGRIDEKDALFSALCGHIRQRVGPHLIAGLREVSKEINIDFVSASIRAQRSRWASCSTKGTISLNYRLAFLPKPLVRYVFIHELCHRHHMNHSPQYWELAERIEPCARALDKELGDAGRALPAWLE
ncbi:M48 family metallopeptidase [Desulfovibrio inopinatus]|uniref:M48 family metallopeptidase n=1 Tax=Desulfovibrio inopinatus TaxID=102109 RepID=UPI0003F7F45F|nr:M48 family metallopeptidase [Desulfovibrio inopinatus]